ncbi:hypothetical protein F4859DRAFT_470767 [Xylaria cf. heliscus]|nr:hypothetical protein F4859DRAFT_470767 [Xylaria cf. heliscus]
MDPVTALGAAGSVVGIAGFGIQLYQILSKFVSQVRSAQEQLEGVIAEVDLTTSALGEIYYYLEKEVRNVETGKALEFFNESSLVKVKLTADKCLIVFWRIETAIAGSEPDGFDEELANRLTSFNRKLASYCTGDTIEIESQLTSDPLRLRDKFRWAFRSSKLERLCGELQRYQSHLGLLLQIVLLGQQQAKQHLTKQDIVEIRQIYAFISKITTPDELRSMALEAQEDGERRRGRSRRPANSRIRWPSEYPQIRPPARRNISNPIQLQGPQRPWDYIYPQAENNFSPSDTETRYMSMTGPLDRWPVMTSETINGPTTLLRRGERQAGNRLSRSSIVGEGRRGEGAVYTKHVLQGSPASVSSDMMVSPTAGVDSGLPLTDLKLTDAASVKDVVGGRRLSAHLPQNRQNDPYHVNGFTDPRQQKVTNNISGKHALDISAQGKTATPGRGSDAGLASARVHSSMVTGDGNTKGQGAKSSLSATTPSEHDLDENLALESPKIDSGVLQGRRFPVQNVIGDSGTGILPYVIQEDGAYRLPMSLQPAPNDANSVLSEHDLAMELALLSPYQLQTLQRLLLYHNEAKPRRLVRLGVTRKRGRKLWQRRSQVTVAFVEGDVSNMPELLPPQEDASNSQTNGIRSAQQVNQGRPPSRIGLPGFQDVTNDLSNNLHTPWSQASNGDLFTEYRVWHIEPYSVHDIGGESVKDWTRSLLKEESLPRFEIKRRLKILDKDPATVIEKSAMLTNAQQFQVWRSIEAAKLGDPDLDYQWSLRQLEIIRARRFFIVKQVKAIIVYVSKTPHLPQHGTIDIPRFAHQNVPHDSPEASHWERIDAENKTTTQRPTSSAGSTSFLRVKRDDLLAGSPKSRKYIERNDTRVDDRPAAEVTNHREQAIAHANSRIASRPPIPSSTRRQTLAAAEEYSEPDYESTRIYDTEREDELVRKIQRLKLEIKHQRELEEESERRGYRSQIRREMRREIEAERGNEVDRAEQKPWRTQGIRYPVHKGQERKASEPEYNTRSSVSRSRDRYAIDEGSSRNGALVRFVERSRPYSSHQLAYHDDPKTEKSRARYPNQFDRRRFDPRSVAESRDAVQQLLLEWTPAQMRDDNDEDSTASTAYDERDSTSDTGSEEYVLAEEFPIPEPSSVLQPEHAESSHNQSTTKVDDDPWSWKVRRKGAQGTLPPTTNGADGHQDFFEQDKEKIAQGDIMLHDWDTWSIWGARSGPISNSPQQLSRPLNKKANDANGADEKPQWDVSQTRASKEPTTLDTNGGVRMYQKGKNIARASTLPQTSRQPWSDEDWARQIVEEAGGTAGDEIGLDRSRVRRASFHFPASNSLGRDGEQRKL